MVVAGVHTRGDSSSLKTSQEEDGKEQEPADSREKDDEENIHLAHFI